MMREAVVLMNGQIIYLDAITNDSVYNPLTTEVVFDFSTGRVKEFTKNNKTYMAFYSVDNDEFLYYIESNHFWKSATFSKKEHDYSTSIASVFSDYVFRVINEDNFSTDVAGFGIIDVDPGTKVIMCKETLGFLENQNQEFEGKFYFHKESFTYPNRPLKSNENIGVGISGLPNYMVYTEVSIPIVNSDIEDYLNSFSSKQYKRIINDQVDYYFEDSHRLIITEITFLFNKIFKNSRFLTFINNPENLDVKKVFQKHFEIINHTGIQPYFHDIYTEPFMNLFRIRLVEFYTWISSTNINNQDDIDVYVRVISLFSEKELMELDYLTKVDILHRLLKGNLWVSGRWNPFYSGNKLTEEETIVKLIRSFYREDNGNIVYSEINSLFDLLNRQYRYSTNKNYSLFQALYEKIQDTILFEDNGKGARGQLVNALYILWTHSKFNPNHQIPSIADNALTFFTYSSGNAQWEFYETGNNNPSIDETKSPAIIPYKSDKKLLWYFDNFKFAFVNNKIYAYQETGKSWGMYLKDILANISNPVLGVYKQLQGKYALYGTYNYFQPISVAEYAKNETIINLPVNPKKYNPNNPCDPNAINNSFPIFYLQYIDDLGDYSDVKNTISTTIDIVLTFTGAGNLTKLRYLQKLSLLRKANFSYAALSSIEKEAIRVAFIRFAVSSAELLTGMASIVHNVVTGGCENQFPCSGVPPAQSSDAYKRYEACQKLQIWLFALELLSMSGDLLAERYFKKINHDIHGIDFNDPAFHDPNHPMPHIDELTLALGDSPLDHVVDDFVDFLASLDQQVVDRINSLNLTEKEKIAFMYDFPIDEAADVHALFKTNPQFIDNWKKLNTLEIPDKTQLDVLKNTVLTETYERFYKIPEIKTILNDLSFTKRKAFLTNFENLETFYFLKFGSQSKLVKYWFRFFDDINLKHDFEILSKTKQIEFIESFGTVNNYWFNRFKKQSYLFDRFNTASTNSILLSKNNPKLWIRINRYYVRPNSLGEKLTSNFIQSKYGNHALSMVDSVEEHAESLYLLHSRSFRDENFQLVSRMLDRETGEMSEIFTNFSKTHFNSAENSYEAYRNSLHPNIREIVMELENTEKSLFNVNSSTTLDFAGYYIGAHAEIRALDDLVKKRFGGTAIDETIFNEWLESSVLGYNRNITVKKESSKVIMHTCVDCFYITDLVNFIK